MRKTMNGKMDTEYSSFNSDHPSYEEIATTKPRDKITTAYCSSKKCTNMLYKDLSNGKKVIKNVAKSCTDCPDCGSVLLWKTKYL